MRGSRVTGVLISGYPVTSKFSEPPSDETMCHGVSSKHDLLFSYLQKLFCVFMNISYILHAGILYVFICIEDTKTHDSLSPKSKLIRGTHKGLKARGTVKF